MHIDLPVSTVTENSNDGAALSFSLRELDSGPDVERGGRTNVETFLAKKSVDHVNGGRVGHVDSARQEREIGGEVVGDSTLSDTFTERLNRIVGSYMYDLPSVIEPLPSRLISPFSTKLNNTLPGGSANQASTRPLLFSVRYLVTPARVPPVPVEQMKASSLPPSVCSQISGPVETMWAFRLATLSNWLVQTAFSREAAYRAAWWL